MKSIVLYFTRTGNSKRIAQKIAEKAGCGLSQITDEKNWKGIFGFLRGGYYAITFRETNPRLIPMVGFAEYDRIAIVGPVWAGNAVPAVFSLLMREKASLDKICLVLSSGGGETAPVFEKLESRIGKIPFKFGIPKNKADEDQAAAQAADVLR